MKALMRWIARRRLQTLDRRIEEHQAIAGGMQRARSRVLSTLARLS